MTNEELIAWLRDPYADGYEGHAADRIEALLREKAAAYAQGYGDCEAEISLTEIGRTNEFLHGQIAKWKARAERLEMALRVARVHVANNAEGWSVSRGAARDDLTIVDAALKE